MAHIVVLVHRQEAFTDAEYFLGPIAELWQEAGHRITVLSGPDKFIEADVAILHVNLTVVPGDHLEFVRRYPRVINGGVADISKRLICAHPVAKGDGYDGPVIVKTDRNYGGLNEALLAGKGSAIVKYREAIRRRMHWTVRSEISSLHYPIFQSTKEVPWPVWHNPDLIVERFQPEMRGEMYCLRSWVFLGDRENSALFTAQQPIIKAGKYIERLPADVPDEIRQIRKELKFDFGKFDYVLVNGRVVLYDVNRTPTIGKVPRDVYLPRLRILAEGLDSFLAADSIARRLRPD